MQELISGIVIKMAITAVTAARMAEHWVPKTMWGKHGCGVIS